jgi:hypothetical protein
MPLREGLFDTHRHHTFFVTVPARVLDATAAEKPTARHHEQINADLKKGAYWPICPWVTSPRTRSGSPRLWQTGLEFRRWFDNSASTGVFEPADGGTAERDRPGKRNGALPCMSSQGICLRLASWW